MVASAGTALAVALAVRIPDVVSANSCTLGKMCTLDPRTDECVISRSYSLVVFERHPASGMWGDIMRHLNSCNAAGRISSEECTAKQDCIVGSFGHCTASREWAVAKLAGSTAGSNAGMGTGCGVVGRLLRGGALCLQRNESSCEADVDDAREGDSSSKAADNGSQNGSGSSIENVSNLSNNTNTSENANTSGMPNASNSTASGKARRLAGAQPQAGVSVCAWDRLRNVCDISREAALVALRRDSADELAFAAMRRQRCESRSRAQCHGGCRWQPAGGGTGTGRCTLPREDVLLRLMGDSCPLAALFAKHTDCAENRNKSSCNSRRRSDNQSACSWIEETCMAHPMTMEFDLLAYASVQSPQIAELLRSASDECAAVESPTKDSCESLCIPAAAYAAARIHAAVRLAAVCFAVLSILL
eukprot:TRINITY_DN16967_c0_g2_i1.p1 TRINITY_DN16967_c0_g2~~TRINITY_DN16967_c0_g2_i1.p1  ORF type:complete len:418 (+),score=36.02 TRINITY_DN16967_c0_g2_i1:47-1300(+)